MHVTKPNQKFTVNLTPNMKNQGWDEGIIYVSTDVKKFNNINIDDEIYVDDMWISSSFTNLI